MDTQKEKTLIQLLTAIRPWFDPSQAFLLDMARTDWSARLAVAAALLESGKEQEAELVLESVATADGFFTPEQEEAQIRASLELAHLKMERLKYSEAEDLLWKAREAYGEQDEMDFYREEISLLIAQCRFGQGFVLESIERAEEIARKLASMNADKTVQAKTHQQLGWFYLNKPDISAALRHIKQAMELAPGLNRELVDEGLKAEQEGQFERAVECYFDAIEYDV